MYGRVYNKNYIIENSEFFYLTLIKKTNIGLKFVGVYNQTLK